MKVYEVWSANGLETRRTDPKVAREDVQIFWEIIHRPVELREVETVAPQSRGDRSAK